MALLVSLGISAAQSFSVLRTFSGTPVTPFGRLLSNSNRVYGTTMGGGTYGNGSVFALNTDGSSYATLKSFMLTHSGANGFTNTDGAQPSAGLALEGNTLYGTAYQGGFWGKGTVFSLRTDGSNFTVLRQFSGSDGKAPYAELLVSSNVIYGTTAAGGISNKGTIFRLNTDGSGFAVLKSFDGIEGLLPLGGLVESGDTLFGTTRQGGAANLGTVFSLRKDGSNFTVLKEFTDADGAYPRFMLVLSGAVLFGTTEGDGDLSNSLVYRLNTDGTDFQVLKTFPPPDPISGTNSEGYYIRTGLVRSGGTLFGTTRWGGEFDSGVIFALRLDGSTYTVLRHFTAVTFDGRNSDGAYPLPSLTASGDSLYGTTENGGPGAKGTIFRLNFAPCIRMSGANSGPGTNGFGFDVTGYANQIVSVESRTNLAAPIWLPMQTNIIGSGPAEFVDGDWTNHLQRFYRLRMQ